MNNILFQTIKTEKEFKKSIVYLAMKSLVESGNTVHTTVRELKEYITGFTGGIINLDTTTLKRYLTELEKENIIIVLFKSNSKKDKSIYKILN